ncbi:hypothetical protein BSL78_10710 [Apostichopus japonicus]|uniref:Uncharacterized protein n=1 Tax=Stichopus japonicus TaxID=307972 RepID=A0A2G8KWL1_STIJA|nr:hypothetical protein BSL78_10710 [Apostichopus japonicus]
MESPALENGIEYKNQAGNRAGTVTLERFKLVATNALLEHDDLQERYLQQQTELQELQAKLAETEASLWKLTNVSEKACIEMVNLHEDLETKIDVEQRCREEAEHYASKMVKENKKIIRENKEIKRKSMALLGQAGLNVFEISSG